MNIVVNGNEENLPPGISISDYLRAKELDPDTIVVEHNLKILESSEFQDALLLEGDKLEILRFFGGG